jgi:hypothetical protein
MLGTVYEDVYTIVISPCILLIMRKFVIKLIEKIKTHEDEYTFVIISRSILLIMRNFVIKLVQKIKIHILY